MLFYTYEIRNEMALIQKALEILLLSEEGSKFHTPF